MRLSPTSRIILFILWSCFLVVVVLKCSGCAIVTLPGNCAYQAIKDAEVYQAKGFDMVIVGYDLPWLWRLFNGGKRYHAQAAVLSATGPQFVGMDGELSGDPTFPAMSRYTVWPVGELKELMEEEGKR